MVIMLSDIDTYLYSHLPMLVYEYLQAILFGDLLVATGLHHKC